MRVHVSLPRILGISDFLGRPKRRRDSLPVGGDRDFYTHLPDNVIEKNINNYLQELKELYTLGREDFRRSKISSIEREIKTYIWVLKSLSPPTGKESLLL